ncbi:MAG: hypothetical protein ACYSUG_03185, partial [Planctomycetota bacterium]
FLKHCLCVCLFGLLLSHSIFAEEPKRHICKDSHTENYFSFISPEGWDVINADKYSGKSKNKVYRLRQQLHIDPLSSSLVAVCYQAGQSRIQQPLVFVYKTYVVGTGSELEEKWLSEKYQKRRKKELAAADKQPFLEGRQVRMYQSQYEYRQDIHTAFETIQGMIDDVPFTRVVATILGGVQHATVACHFEGDDSYNAAAAVEQIINTFEFEAENVFGGPLEQRALRQRKSGMDFIDAGSMLFFCTPMAFGATLGLWLSARHYDIPCKFYIALLAGVVGSVIFMLPPHDLHVSGFLSGLIIYAILAAFVREDYIELTWITGYGLLGGAIGFMAIWAYIWIGAALSDPTAF